ncbi:MAG: hypothetical protein KKH52_00690 [Nanoarchaeota archaeon]|nr:hypothetical protein [Nanoarchaeota archaeon]MBU1622515.1 hypothetical protein [Nanoarchaeota archaeon]MBU1973893.1 hypothetical protein [Nanoarchaeota archaeon]
MEQPSYQRQVAIKTIISDILAGEFVKEEENKSDYLLTPENEKIYRLNLFAIVLNKEKVGNITNILLDDGSGKINLRYFEDDPVLEELQIGEVILVIGKLRSYNQEKYLAPEIVKKINSLWLKVRSLEMAKEVKEIFDVDVKVEVEKVIDEVADEDNTLPVQKIIKIINELDQGEGVLIEEIISNSVLNGTEQIIEKMLENGEIFQISPGKVKVL